MLENLGYGPQSNSSSTESSIHDIGSRAILLRGILEDVHNFDPEVNATDVKDWINVDEIIQQGRESHTLSVERQVESKIEEEKCPIT